LKLSEFRSLWGSAAGFSLKNFFLSEPFTQFQRRRAMAAQAERPNVIEVAFPSPLHHSLNVVSIPKAFATVPLEPPKFQQRSTSTATRMLHPPIGRERVDATGDANASIAQQYFFAQVCRL
jgi:hypothetical protein